MTRDEAVKALSDANRSGQSWQEDWIDSFVALGMLKLDEPKSVMEKFAEAMRNYGYTEQSYTLWSHIKSALDNANLKIVEKTDDKD